MLSFEFALEIALEWHHRNDWKFIRTELVDAVKKRRCGMLQLKIAGESKYVELPPPLCQPESPLMGDQLAQKWRSTSFPPE